MNNEIVLVLGRKGSGKSSLVKNVLIKDKKRLIIIDVQSEYDDYLIIEDFESLDEYISEHKEFKIACRFTNDKDLYFLFSYVFIEGNLTLCCDELSKYVSAYKKGHPFSDLINFGRHKQIDIIGVARRPAELSREFRSQADIIYSFYQYDEKDLQVLNEMGIYEADKLENPFNYNKFKGVPEENRHYKKIAI